MRAREATLDDSLEILNICLPYAKESVFGRYEIDDKECYFDIYSAITQDNRAVFVVEDEGIVGVAGMIKMQTFFKNNDWMIDFFYIVKESRGTRAAVLLRDALLEFAYNAKIDVLRCGCHSGMGDLNDKLFCNLFKKRGFEVTGTNLHLFMERSND